MKANKKILIVSPFFAPENSVASVRFTKIGKYLAKMGYTVDVLCSNMMAEFIEDETLKPDLKWFHRIIRQPFPALYYLPLRCAIREGAGAKDRERCKDSSPPVKTGVLMKLLGKIWKLIRNDTTMSIWVDAWDRLLAAQYYRTLKKEKLLPYDGVITTYSPLLSHYLGERLKRKGLCRVWIADYRDNFWAFEKKEKMPAYLFRSNARLEKRADFITVVSEGEKKQLIAESLNPPELLAKKLRVVRNGFDPEEREALGKENGGSVEAGKLVFTYCGTLQQVDELCSSDLSAFFRALAELIEEGKVEAERLLFQYAGRSCEKMKETATRYGLLSIVKDYGYVDRAVSLRLQHSGDITLVCTWNRENRQGIISGKFYEAAEMGKPLLVLVTGPLSQSEVKSMVEEYQLGFCWEEAELEYFSKLKEWILAKYREKERKGVLAFTGGQKSEELGHDRLAEQFAFLLTGNLED